MVSIKTHNLLLSSLGSMMQNDRRYWNVESPTDTVSHTCCCELRCNPLDVRVMKSSLNSYISFFFF